MSFPIEEYQKLRNDPYYFATKCVWTQDPTDKVNPIKRFPRDKDYLKLYCRIWQQYKRIAVPKSRRMIMSWMNVILYTHDTVFFKGRHNAFISKKEEDSDALVCRSEFILDNIKEEDLPRELIPTYKKTYCNLEFPDIYSKIQGFPSGSDQLRMHGFSGILADEMAFWDNAQAMYAATFPTIENGGRFTAISSAAPGFFNKLVFDGLDE